MKRIILSAAVALATTTSIFAQDACCAEGVRGFQTNFETAPFWSNWYISANVGAQSFISNKDRKADFNDRITVLPTLSIGKQFNPYFGVRVQGMNFAGPLHTFDNNGTQMIHNYYGAFHADVMFGLVNFFAPYKENRRFEITPFVGMGGLYVKDGRSSFTLNSGIQTSYRFSKRVAANIEYQALFTENNALKSRGNATHMIHGLTAGITVNVGKVGFNKAYSSAQYNNLAQDNKSLLASCNDLRNAVKNKDGIIAQQNAEINALKNRKPEVIKEGANLESLPISITFPFNSSKVGKTQELTILNLATFLKENPTVNVNLTGFTDKTGSAQYNEKLSQKRAKSVAKMLVDKFGIAESRISTEGKGISTKYDVNAWNRVVDVRMK